MLKDDKYFEKLRNGEAPQLPSSLATFVGQSLCNHYEDTVRSPLPDDMKRKLGELGCPGRRLSCGRRNAGTRRARVDEKGRRGTTPPAF